MKKIFKFICTSIFFSSLLILTSCQDPIFYEIRHDVQPEEATINGNINNITRFGDRIYIAANFGLRSKPATSAGHGQWIVENIPFEFHRFDFDSKSHVGEVAITVLADKDYLYLFSAAYADNSGISTPSKITIWSKKAGEDWKVSKASERIYKATRIFQTNSIVEAHRAAFIYDPVEEKCYKLNGENQLEDSDIVFDPETDTLFDTNATGVPCSAVYFDSGFKFLKTRVSTTNADDSIVYYTNNSELRYAKGSEKGLTLSTYTTISALAVCSDSILIGLGDPSTVSIGGLKKANLNSQGIPADHTSDFTTNADFQITTEYCILALLNATPEKSELDSNLYASVTCTSNGNLDNIGLWSYYPGNIRGNWNRE